MDTTSDRRPTLVDLARQGRLFDPGPAVSTFDGFTQPEYNPDQLTLTGEEPTDAE